MNKNKIFIHILFAFFLLASCKNDYIAELEHAYKTVPVTDIFIPDGNSVSLVKTTTKNLQAKALPENAADKKLTYSSSSENIASVNSDGLITAKEIGNAVVTIKAASGVQKIVNVTVTAAPVAVTSIGFEETPPASLTIGEVYKLKAKVQPDTATDKTLTYAASNDNVQIAEDGTVTAVKEGTVNITIVSKSSPSIKKQITITVKRKPEIKIDTKEVENNSNEEHPTFKVKTLHDKLAYTPEVVGSGAKWLSFDKKDSTSSTTEDTIYLKAELNKTVWDRTAYIKFRGADGKYIKGADGKELEVKFTQKKNEHPNVTIKWVYGIGEPTAAEKKPVEIPHSSPKDYHKMPYVFHWYETEHTKFFNTRKMGPTGSSNQGFPDSNQCWAKSSSNMLHWWFEQNKENVEKYIEKKGITKENNPEKYKMYNPYYTRGLPDTEENVKSSIANEFRTKCPDSLNGNWIYSGLRWYLYGLEGLAKNKTYSPALFNDVFGKNEDENENNDPVVPKTTSTKKEFEDVLKDALLNSNSKKAVGVHVHDEGKYGHGITLWGAAFDEENNVIAIYVCDNNDRENRIFTYGIYYKSDIYADDPQGTAKVYPYLINYNTNMKLNKYVGMLVTLDKGEEQWKAWQDKNP